MRKLIAAVGVVAFVAALGVSSASAVTSVDYTSACVKMKKNGDPKRKTTYKRAALGTSPGSPCGGKEEQVTLPTDRLTDDLQNQITANKIAIESNDTDIAANTAAIESNDDDIMALQTQTGDNTDAIDEIKTSLISSMIGGSHNLGSPALVCHDTVDVCTNSDCSEMANVATDCASGPISVTTNDNYFMGMYVTRGTGPGGAIAEGKVQQKATATGIVTKMSVNIDDVPDGGTMEFSFRVNGAEQSLACTILGDGTTCTVEGCVQVTMGDEISVRQSITVDDTSVNLTPARWNARFVEGGICVLD